MAKPQRKRSKPKRKEKGGSGKLIGRIVVYSLLAILLVVGLLEFRVKSQASATGEAWREASRKTPEHEEFLQSQLE